MLFNVWSSQDPPATMRQVNMFALDAEFGGNSKVALLGINADPDRAAGGEYVQSNHLDHWVMASAPELNGLPEEYKHISGGAVLIGPDGNVIAKHLFGDHVASLLRRELAK